MSNATEGNGMLGSFIVTQNFSVCPHLQGNRLALHHLVPESPLENHDALDAKRINQRVCEMRIIWKIESAALKTVSIGALKSIDIY